MSQHQQPPQSATSALLGKCVLLQQLAVSILLLTASIAAQAKDATALEQDTSSKFKLNCSPGEQRLFNYESNTNLWGSTEQQVRLRAALKLRCMGADNSSSPVLKYLAEILSMEVDQVDSEEGGVNQVRAGKQVVSARAEPVFEEVTVAISDAADRVKRSVSGWFTKTWDSVKEWVVNIFSSSERSTSSREDVMRETGVDIGRQCSKSAKGTPGLPIDESVFDDLEPKYYTGASMATFYEFKDLSSSDPKQSGTEDENISFFDDPTSRRRRTRRSSDQNRPPNHLSPDRMIKLPFIMVQSNTGQMLEVRFSDDDSEASIRNFKRHICDLFATNVQQNSATETSNQIHETSPIGRHKTSYLSSTNSTTVEHTLTKQVKDSGGQLAQALAMVEAGQSLERNPQEPLLVVGGSQGNATSSPMELSVLRTINSTSKLQLATRIIAPDLEQVQVRLRQLQRISEGGRLTASSGHLSMNLIQSDDLSSRSSNNRRLHKRATDGDNPNQLVDAGELFKVSSSFSLQLVPSVRLGKYLRPADRRKKTATSDELKLIRIAREAVLDPKRPSSAKSAPLITKPKDGPELEAALRELKELESRFRLTSGTSLEAESSALENKRQRMELLRDQVQQRINEELLRIRARNMQRAQLMAAASSPSAARQQVAGSGSGSGSSAGELGLSLSRVILDNGWTTRRKGSMLSTMEELLDLEAVLMQDDSHQHVESSMSSLLRETARLQAVKSHCLSSLATLDQLRNQANRDELRLLDRRLSQCQRVLLMLVRANHRPAQDILIEMIDECNVRLLACSKNEELGHGPVSRYYRQVRQQLSEVLTGVHKPSDALLDKLAERLHYSLESPTNRLSSAPIPFEPEYSFVTKPKRGAHSPGDGVIQYNRSLLLSEDDYNNIEGSGSLVMSLTELAAKPTISSPKRAQIVERLFKGLGRGSCSQMRGPDVDILEAMSNFQEPLESVSTRILQLARRCKNQEQYVIACVHGLRGQLSTGSVQKFLIDLLRSTNTTCTVKSEIVLTLMDALQVELLKQVQNISGENRQTVQWPAKGLNQLDNALINLIETRQPTPDTRCLSSLVRTYIDRKEAAYLTDGEQQATSRARSIRTSGRRRNRRAIVNEDNFWDEAQCKKWSQAGGAELSSNLLPPMTLNSDLLDSDQSNHLLQYSSSNRSLVEKESIDNSSVSNSLRRRHKCEASKNWGPKNAQARLSVELVNDLVGPRDENKFLTRFRLGANFLSSRLDLGRMYLWHEKGTTRAHASILGKSLWDTSHGCHDQAPKHIVYLPLFDLSLWLVKLTAGLRVHTEMGFFSDCRDTGGARAPSSDQSSSTGSIPNDKLELRPTIQVRASAESSAKFLVARAGMSLAANYGYQGRVRVSPQPESCMSVQSSHQPMNLSMSSWVQLWDSDCHFWGSRGPGMPTAMKWRIPAKPHSVWLDNECLNPASNSNSTPPTAAKIRIQ